VTKQIATLTKIRNAKVKKTVKNDLTVLLVLKLQTNVFAAQAQSRKA